MSWRSTKPKTDHRVETARQLETIEVGARISSPVSALQGTKRDGTTHWIPLNRITTRSQIREEFDEEALNELANSLQVHGQRQACLVFWSDDEQMFVIVAGERRFRAAQIAAKETLRCDVMAHEPSAEEHHELQLIENVQREDLNPIEEAKAYYKFVEDFNYTQQQISQKTGKSQGAISRALKLMKLPPEIREELVEANAPRGLAESLARVGDIAEQRRLLEQYRNGEVTVKEASRSTSKRTGSKSTANKQTRVKKVDGIDLKATGKKKHTNTDYAVATLVWCEDLASSKKASVDKEQIATRCCNLMRTIGRGADSQVTAVLLEELRNLTAEVERLQQTPPALSKVA